MGRNDISGRIHELEEKIDRVLFRLDELSSRISNYVGNGIAYTHLKNGNLIYVNSNDFGPPANFMDGGVYEPDNLQVILSFIRDDSVFVDIGANLGFFSLVVGDRMRRSGQVIAFEPQPAMVDLFERSIHHNGLHGVVTVYPFGLSDAPGRCSLWAPKGHKGGASLGEVPEGARGGFDEIVVDVRRLDDLFGGAFACDLVKIDVEGHELSVLQGMRGVVERSPQIKILFEKLVADAGAEGDLAAYFADFGMTLHGVVGHGLTPPLGVEQLRDWQGYLLAARPSSIDRLDRRGFSIYPRQLQGGTSHIQDGQLEAEGPGLMVHGPYWHLPRGSWRLTVRGEARGDITCIVSEQFGHKVAAQPISGKGAVADFVVQHDLAKFECAFWGAAGAKLSIERLDWRRID